MSQLQAIADRLRSLAQDASPLSANVHSSANQLNSLAQQVESLTRLGVNTGALLGAIQEAQARAVSAADAVSQVKSEGVAWADYLARGGGVSPEPASLVNRQASGEMRPSYQIQALDDIRAWLGEVNPGYTGDPFDPRSNNCGECAAAVHSRLSGKGKVVAGHQSLSASEMESRTGRSQVRMSSADIESELRARGPGSHAVIGIDRSRGPGHWFNAYFDGTRVVAIDGQSGTITGWPPDYGDVILWDAGV